MAKKQTYEQEHWDYPPTFVHHPGEHGLPKNLEKNLETISIETICGGFNESQPVEQYNGKLGVTKDFVKVHETSVGQLQWNRNLADIYEDPGTVSGVRWCSGTMISEDLYLTAGHCFDQTGGGWRRPIVNGTTNIIPSEEIASNMHVNFNFQVEPGGKLRVEQSFAVLELVEYRLGNLDYAILRLAGNPGRTFGKATISASDATKGEMLCIIGHPSGLPKRIEAGPAFHFHDHKIGYDSIDTLPGNSGSAILRSSDGSIVGVHTNGGCDSIHIGHNHGYRITSLRVVSSTIARLTPTSVPALSLSIFARILRWIFGTTRREAVEIVQTYEGEPTGYYHSAQKSRARRIINSLVVLLIISLYLFLDLSLKNGAWPFYLFKSVGEDNIRWLGWLFASIAGTFLYLLMEAGKRFPLIDKTEVFFPKKLTGDPKDDEYKDYEKKVKAINKHIEYEKKVKAIKKHIEKVDFLGNTVWYTTIAFRGPIITLVVLFALTNITISSALIAATPSPTATVVEESLVAATPTPSATSIEVTTEEPETATENGETQVKPLGISIDMKNAQQELLIIIAFILGYYNRLPVEILEQIAKSIFRAAWENAKYDELNENEQENNSNKIL